MVLFAEDIPVPVDSNAFSFRVICSNLGNTSLLLQVHFLVEFKSFWGVMRGISPTGHMSFLRDLERHLWMLSGSEFMLVFFLVKMRRTGAAAYLCSRSTSQVSFFRGTTSQPHTSLGENLPDIPVLQVSSRALVVLPAFPPSPHSGAGTGAASPSLSRNVSPIIK